MTGRLSRVMGALAVAGTVLLGCPGRARALEIAGSGSLGAFTVGSGTRLTAGPGLWLRLGPARGASLTLQDSLALFPGPGRFGFDNTTSVGVGYSWASVSVDLSAALSQYWMPACGPTLCGQVMGLAPGARARVAYFPLGPLGLAVTADAGWYGGGSLVLPGGPALSLVAGPALRWQSR